MHNPPKGETARHGMESEDLRMASGAPDVAAKPMNRRLPQPAQLLNRELGILAFNRRVLAQATDETVPLLERLRFITLVSSNLDEFFEIRVAGLKETIKLGLPEPSADGRPPAEVFQAIAAEAHALVADQYRLLNEVVLPALGAQGIVFLRREQWTAAQRDWSRAGRPKLEIASIAARQVRPESRTYGSPTCSDWVFLRHVDAVKCGPGTSRRSHTADESVDVAEVTAARTLYARIASEYLA